MDGKIRAGEPRVVHLDDATFARGQADLGYAVSLAQAGNTAMTGFIVAAANKLSGQSQPEPHPIPHGLRGKLADGFVIIYLRDHPSEDPTAEEIAAASKGMFDAKDIRRSKIWVQSQNIRGRRTEQVNDLGENDEALDALKITKTEITDRRTIRKNG